LQTIQKPSLGIVWASFCWDSMIITFACFVWSTTHLLWLLCLLKFWFYDVSRTPKWFTVPISIFFCRSRVQNKKSKAEFKWPKQWVFFKSIETTRHLKQLFFNGLIVKTWLEGLFRQVNDVKYRSTCSSLKSNFMANAMKSF